MIASNFSNLNFAIARDFINGDVRCIESRSFNKIDIAFPSLVRYTRRGTSLPIGVNLT